MSLSALQRIMSKDYLQRSRMHLKLCKFKSDCKFNKKNICFFKHETSNTKVTNEIEALEEEVSNLKEEISDLKKEIKTKEEVLEEKTARLVFQSETENDLTKQNQELKDLITLIQKENVNLKVEIIIQQKIIQSHADQSESECTS